MNPTPTNRLEDCNEEEIGFPDAAPAYCPGIEDWFCGSSDSVAGRHTLGEIYLAAPQNFVGIPENPFRSLFAVYVVAEEPKTGVLVKLAGDVSLDPATGQITGTFDDNPQFPFSELKVSFFGGPRAPLANPQTCGSYTTDATFTPWSAPETPDATSSSSFAITEGCADPLPFAPTLNAGTTNPQAGVAGPRSSVHLL